MIEKQREQAHNLTNIVSPVDQLKQEISRVIIGNGEAIDLILMAILCDGHVLLEEMQELQKQHLSKLLHKRWGYRLNAYNSRQIYCQQI
jgi:MoxR-like ATPase